MYNSYFKLLNRYKYCLSKQQYKTFKGQILAGDVKGFMKGLCKILGIKYERLKGVK